MSWKHEAGQENGNTPIPLVLSTGSALSGLPPSDSGSGLLERRETSNGASLTVPSAPMSGATRYSLLALFCLAQLLDMLNASMLFPVLPVIGRKLGMDASDLQWLFSGYSLAFASFLLLTGRLSDIYSPKWTFICGVILLSLASLGAGFVPSKIGLLTLRGFQGLGATLTIPSALSMISRVFPEDDLRSRALAIFGAVGVVGGVSGLLIGAAFSEFATYSWCFWVNTCAGVPATIAAIFLIPSLSSAPSSLSNGSGAPERPSKRSLDYVGVSLLTICMILFVFGVTSGSTVGWNTAQVWAPVIASVAILTLFLWWETRLPGLDAALPPSIWFYPNFAVLLGLSLLPYGWWAAIFLLFSQLWQDSYGISSLETALRLLPLGVSSYAVIVILASLPPSWHPKRVIGIGIVAMLVSGAMLPFCHGLQRYWSLIFPAMVLGGVGSSLIYITASVAIFQTTPKSRAGLTGAAFNSALELGVIILVSVVTTVSSSINNEDGDDPFNGISASLWFLFAFIAVEGVVTLLFYRETKARGQQEEMESGQLNADVVIPPNMAET